MSKTVLQASGLRVSLDGAEIVRDVSLTLAAGESLALIGESGSGKTMTALALMGLLPPAASLNGGRIVLSGREAASGRRAADGMAMVFQEPMTALNPVHRVGEQIAEAARQHEKMSARAARALALSLLEQVRIPNPKVRIDAWPHELSGGMRQRAMIAMALACRPKVLIADEPTTALDATVQTQILALLSELRAALDMAVLLITHDFGVVAAMASRAAVMYRGRIVEEAEVARLLKQPAHPYTRALLACIPRPGMKTLPAIPGHPPPPSRTLPQGCGFAPRCALASDTCRAAEPGMAQVAESHLARCFFPQTDAVSSTVSQSRSDEDIPQREFRESGDDSVLLQVRGLHVQHSLRGGWLRHQVVRAVDDVDLDIAAGESLGLVGETGCGKSTLGRAIMQLTPARAGDIRLCGESVLSLRGAAARRARRRAQMVFQDPQASLDPRRSVGFSVCEPLLVHGERAADARKKAAEALAWVGLDESAMRQYPHQLSGGQRQRVGFARAAVLRPRLIVADEPVSALDMSVQAQVLNLMQDLKTRLGLGYLFISHDLAAVAHLCERVAVMYLGKIVETAPADMIFSRAAHPYTRGLLACRLPPAPGARLAAIRGETPSQTPAGCRFHSRCPRADARCRETPPPLRPLSPLHFAACHYAEEIRASAPTES